MRAHAHRKAHRMKITVWIALAVALLGGCGERVASYVSEVRAPEITQPGVKRERAFVSSVPENAPANERRQRAEPDFKDSAGSLDRSK